MQSHLYLLFFVVVAGHAERAQSLSEEFPLHPVLTSSVVPAGVGCTQSFTNHKRLVTKYRQPTLFNLKGGHS